MSRVPHIRYLKHEDDGGWGVIKEGHRNATAYGSSRADALRTARYQMRGEGGGEIRVLNETGKVIEVVKVDG